MSKITETEGSESALDDDFGRVRVGDVHNLAIWSGSLVMVSYQRAEEVQNRSLQERGGCVFPLI